MKFLLLGPLEAHQDGIRLHLGHRRAERCLLGLLLLEAGRVVPVDRLVGLLWDDPPPNARAIVQTHVSRLRSRLDPGRDGRNGLRLLARGDGYIAEAEADDIDVYRFRRQVEEAGGLPDPADRARRLREALALWRGPLLADVASDRLRDRIGTGLEEQRLSALEACMEAELGCGRHRQVTPELSDLVRDHPLRERLRAALMLALYRDGRQSEALDTYREARAQLADELGLDPGTELRHLHEAILRGDPALESESVLPRGPDTHPLDDRPVPPQAVVPAQLPPMVAGFTGRDLDLLALDKLLDTDDDRAPTAVIISAIAGTAGVGKTALAVYWAHRIAERFPDGQLYVNLRGFGPAASRMDPAEAARGFLEAFHVPSQRIPTEASAQIGLYRSIVAGKRVLVVLDNARDADQVRPLLPGTPGCLTVVTSRNQLTGLVATEGAQSLTIDLLTGDEARDLLGRRLGRDRIAAEPQAVADLIASCARLPLALAIAAARAATNRALPLSALAAQLRQEASRLDAFASDDPATNVRAVFSWSYQALSADSARLFRLLGLHPGPDISTRAAASLAGIAADDARAGLTELAGAHLIIEHSPGRYTLHDLLRAYATEQTQRADPAAERDAATRRLLDHYLHTAHAADRVLDPVRDPITLDPPAPGTAPEQFADHWRALAWFTVEHPVLLAAVDHAATAGLYTHTWQLAWTLGDYLDRRGHWHDEASTSHAAVAAGWHLGDPSAQARAHRVLGRAYRRLGAYDDACAHLRQALDLYGEAGDGAGQAQAHHGLGIVLGWQGRYVEALDHAYESLRLFEAASHRQGYARALNSVGWYHTRLGNHEQALVDCARALGEQQELHDRDGEANTWDSLGYAHHHLGHHDEAIRCYERAIAMFHDQGDRYEEATTLSNLGDAQHAAGRADGARRTWLRALTILDELGHPDADQLRERLDETGLLAGP